jgi:hypothetical protein
MKGQRVGKDHQISQHRSIAFNVMDKFCHITMKGLYNIELNKRKTVSFNKLFGNKLPLHLKTEHPELKSGLEI